MANRFFNQFRFSMEKNVVDLFAKVAIGAVGAPTLSRGKGVASISRTSAGLYVITLQDTYNLLLGVFCTQVKSAVPLASPVFNVVSNTIDTGGKTITVQFSGPTGTAFPLQAVEVDNGATLLLKIQLSNSASL